MKTTVQMTILAALFAVSSCANAHNSTSASSQQPLTADPWGPHRVRSGPLHAHMIVERQLGRNTASVILLNRSDQFLCIDSRMLDTRYQHILLLSQSGEPVRLGSYAEMGPNTLLEFNYDDPYLFILPHETRRIEVDLANLKITSGTYRYDLVFLYYQCQDIIDKDRIKAGKDIGTFAVHEKGTVKFLPEE